MPTPKKAPSIQMPVTHIEDTDRALLVTRDGGREAHSIFIDVLIEARRKKNGGVFTCSLAALGLVIQATADQIQRAVDLIAEVCRENGTEPWLLIESGCLRIRSFTKYHAGWGGDRSKDDADDAEGARRVKCAETRRLGTRKKAHPDSDSDSDSKTPPTPPCSAGGQGTHEPLRGEQPTADAGGKSGFTEADVESIAEVWAKAKRGDPKNGALCKDIRNALTRLSWGTQDGMDPESIQAAGGPAAFLLAQTRTFVSSPTATKDNRRFMGSPKSFFGTGFLTDPAEWGVTAKRQEARARSPTREAWRGTAEHWRALLREKQATNDTTQDWEARAIGAMRRDGFEGTDDEARAAIRGDE